MKIHFLSVFGKNLGVKWLGNMIDLCLIFKEIDKHFPEVMLFLHSFQ